MRLTIDRTVEGLQAAVTIDRYGGKVEMLQLQPMTDKPLVLESAVAPAEPYEFSTLLRLKTGDGEDVLRFRMVEPIGHHH